MSIQFSHHALEKAHRKEGPSYGVIEAGPNVHLELDEKGKIIGIEIWNAKIGLIKQVAKAITNIVSENPTGFSLESVKLSS